MQTECRSGQFEFEGFDGRRVVAAFDGGAVTSDAGTVLLREADRAIGLIERVAACFTDHREADQVIHALPTLIGQRIVAIALGYEDVNDHDTLRRDPVLALFSDQLEPKRKDCATLAGKSTINRLEHAPREVGDRYHKIGHDAQALERVFVDVFLGAYGTPPEEIVLHLDATDDPLTATRRVGSSTATTTAGVICRSTCSAAGICWRRSCGARTSTPRPGRRTRWRASSPTSAGAGRRCGSCSAPIVALPARS
jgi:hypothetical protein